MVFLYYIYEDMLIQSFIIFSSQVNLEAYQLSYFY